MSLDWHLTDIADYETLCWLDRPEGDPTDGQVLNPVTNALIWGTVAVGIGVINANNVEAFHTRFAFYEKLFGAMMRRATPSGFEDVPMTLADVRAHVGLRTNATTESNTAWTKRMMEAWNREMAQVHKRETTHATVA